MSATAIESLDSSKNTRGKLKLLPWLLAAGHFTLVAVLIVCVKRNLKSYKAPKFSINGAYLTRFNYTETNHTLSYNLALNITLTNPNKKIHFEFFDTQVIAYYQSKRFGVVTLMDRWATFHQDPKNTTIFQNAVVQGWKSILFEGPVLPKFNVETHADLYGIDVVIAFHERVVDMSGQVVCNLNLPMSFSGASWDSFKPTKCSKVSL